ncbi:hypothetical protein QVD17_20422 [Tagetes erecta]|uniref:Uncharacterized protein n=1 Tax=Tagetes erecta TaxID=13708 RepID=A0AAD8KP42_TARER|nr:hypothetical protein QVD17_20422 [Tagetes erecta]
MSIMLVDCSNCHTPLHLPPGAKSIRCAICQSITPIANSNHSTTSPFPGLIPSAPSPSRYTSHDPSYPTGYTPVHNILTNMPSPSPYGYGPAAAGYGGGRKKAVIVGVSYRNTRHELKGCINDAKYMKHLLLTKFQFPESSIVMLTEEENDPSRIPTGRNMRAALSWLINGCQSGDSLLFHFSGHGSRQRNHNGDELDGYDETLCPLDFETEGMIVDDEINATIVRPLPYGVRLHAVIDSCHSGTVLDLPFLCRMNRNGQYEWEDHRPKDGIWKGSSGGEVISISGCDDDQTSADTSALSKITSTGAMTYCFIEAIEHGNASTYGSLLSSMRNAIRNAPRGFSGGGSVLDMLSSGGLNGNRGFTQEPQLTSCEPFDMYTKPFGFCCFQSQSVDFTQLQDMTKRTKKAGIVGKYGTRYGASLRKQIKKMEVSQHSKFFCEFCGKYAVKRKAVGIWGCKDCGKVKAGGAYTLNTASAVTVRSTIRRLREQTES